MAGSTQAILEGLFVDLILYSRAVSASSNPTNTLVTTFLNQATLYIANNLEPQELRDSSGTAANIVAGANTVALPSAYLKAYQVFYQTSEGKWVEVQPRNIASMLDARSPNAMFDTTKVGTPTAYTLQGDMLLFDVRFDRTATGAIKVFGLNKPTTLSTASASGTTQLGTDFDLLIIYRAAELHYIREEDFEAVNNYQALRVAEEVRIRRAIMDATRYHRIEPDSRFFNTTSGGIDDPNVFFSS